MHLKAFCSNRAWFLSQAPAYRRFRSALDAPAKTQEAVLFRILRANQQSAFGRRYEFSTIGSAREFQQRVPLSTYSDYETALSRIRAGDRGVLTLAPVRRLAPTSGSTKAVKLIPYTTALQKEFSAAIGPWVYDLFRSDPDLMRGPAYWSVTPSIQPVVAGSAVPIGFEEDSEYLGGFWRFLVNATLAVPGSVARIYDQEQFRLTTLRHLLETSELRLISIWHPSFLTLLLQFMEEHWDKLVTQVSKRQRRDMLRSVEPRDFQSIWPRLKLISCWAEGPAILAANGLRRSFPHVRIQPKGLMATEAFVTIPFANAHPVALTSHFFEFLDGKGQPRLAEDLSVGAEYSLVVTTSGGFYRYRLGDRIRVTKLVGKTPSCEFIGREGGIVDVFGEKLNEDFVANALSVTLTEQALKVSFAMIVPESTALTGRYTLFLDCDSEVPGAMAWALEQRLRENPHYALCVSLSQLSPVRVEHVKAGAFERYLGWCSQKGKRLGNVKPTLLCADTSVAPVLRGTQLP